MPQIDYFERAKRLEEIPLIKKAYEEQRVKDMELWELQEEERVCWKRNKICLLMLYTTFEVDYKFLPSPTKSHPLTRWARCCKVILQFARIGKKIEATF